MPQFTGSLTVADSASVSVSYAPELVSSALTILVDRRETTREKQPTITLGFNRPTSTRKTYKVKRSYAVPIWQTVSGVDVVTDIARANVEYVLPPSASLTVRKDLRALVANTEDLAFVKASVEDLDPPY